MLSAQETSGHTGPDTVIESQIKQWQDGPGCGCVCRIIDDSRRFEEAMDNCGEARGPPSAAVAEPVAGTTVAVLRGRAAAA